MLRIVVFDKEFYKELGESVFVDEFQRKWRIKSVQKKFFRTKLSILDYPIWIIWKICNTETYQDILYQLTTRQKELLLAIGREGQAQQITGSAFIKRYRLSSASSVQKAAETLVRQHIITHDKGVFEIYDKFFALWLATM